MARRAALGSDFKVRVGCVAYYKGKLVATGASMEKTHPMQHVYNFERPFDRTGKNCIDKVHAEMQVISRLKNMNIRMSDVTIYVVRLCKSRPLGLSRPCPACMKALKEAGVFDIRYSTNYGYAREWIGLDIESG